ncbi:sigma-70 family RNA polymerase sigma factor [Echinicola marina]|uniref:RNA polymerase sigma factor n=1 Tax=Echinicola marina TaxID=2859768 RepID=UPI001CF651DA|nr:sigma-70 family RNA polymerase sigma factor [Echinicola marina]UCS91732.1 sigma-70 family RNA polymerase sigma factor [Echinicola marina]
MEPIKSPEITDSTQRKYTEKEYQEMPDELVWKSFCKGNEFAFNYIYKNYASDIFSFGYQFCGDSHLVEDCIQNVFIYLRRKREKLGEVKSIKSYLFRCIQCEIIKRLKERGMLVDTDQLQYKKAFNITLSPETIMIESESQEQKKRMINLALDKLTLRQRQALILLYEEEMSYSEIAEVMGFNEVKSARKLVYRALASLKEVINPF